MNENGFISLDRKITKWEWYDDINTMRLFLHLLLTVNWEDGRWHGVEVKRGQRITSLGKLSKELKLSIQNVRTSLSHLKLTGEITDIQQSNYRLITVTKYNEYQDPNRRTNRVLTGNQQGTNNNITSKQRNKETSKQESGGSSNAPTPAQTMEDFVLSVETKTESITELASRIGTAYKIPADQVSAEFDKFVNYWCELTKDGKKKRWQLEKTFEVKRRLATWFTNVAKFSNTKNQSTDFSPIR